MKRWKRGHIVRFWNESDYRDLPYVKQPISDKEIEEWKSQGYDYVKSFSGSMYDNRNPTPKFVETFKQIFGFQNMTFNFYKMSQLEIMPEHVDHYTTYMKLFGVEYKHVRRILVMLEDWKPGHYLEINKTGIVNWAAGDYFIWESDVPHAASNIGIEDRYTLQITYTDVSTEDIFRTLHWFNFKDLKTKYSSLHSDHMIKIKASVDKGRPFYVYMFNETIKDLEQINHTPEDIKHYNDVGIDFYLFEPICSYRTDIPQYEPPNGTKHSLLFYSEFRHDVDVNKLRSTELDSIQAYADRNNLTNVTVYTCDKNIEKYYQDNYTINLKTDDIFLKTFNVMDFEEPDNKEAEDQFSRKFICMNWRYTPHRQLIVSYLGNLDSIYLSWFFKSDLWYFSQEPWYDLGKWRNNNSFLWNKIITGNKVINEKSPFCLDLQIKEHTLIKEKYFKDYFPVFDIYKFKIQVYGDIQDRLKKFYNDIFCDIVTETRFAQPTANFSEKTLRPIFHLKPFILAAPPYTLAYLREFGFKTFNDFWDEGYDNIENHELRLALIIFTIEKLNKKSIGELREMYSNMKPLLEHNKKVLLENAGLRGAKKTARANNLH